MLAETDKADAYGFHSAWFAEHHFHPYGGHIPSVPVLGAAVLYALGEFTRNLFGELPGLSMVIYGAVLILIVMFLPRGMTGAGASIRRVLGMERKAVAQGTAADETRTASREENARV